MSDLAEKILEAIEVKMAKAQAASPGPWTLYDRGFGWEINELPDVHDGTTFTKADAEFIADNGPDGVLRCCAADREIVQSFIAVDEDPDRHNDAALHLVWNVMKVVMRKLARGYGVQPTPGDDHA